MQHFFAPAMYVMNRFTFPVKFALILGLVMLPLISVTVLYTKEKNNAIDSTVHELEGLAYFKAIRTVIEPLQIHRGLMALIFNGEQLMKPNAEQKRTEVDKAFQALQQIDKELGISLVTKNHVGELLKQWEDIKSRLTALTKEESFQLHSDLIKALLEQAVYVSNTSEITIDPSVDTYYLGDALTKRLPDLTELLGHVRARTATVASIGTLDTFNLKRLVGVFENIEKGQSSVTNSLEYAFKDNNVLAASVKPALTNANKAIDSFQEIVNNQILGDKVSADSKTVFANGTQAITQVYALIDDGLKTLDTLLKHRVAELRQFRNSSLVIEIGLILFMLYLFIGLFFATKQTIANLTDVTKQYAKGNLTVRVNLASKDELARIGNSFNDMAEQFEALVQQVISVSSQLASASEEVAAVSHESASSVDRQRVETDQVATAMNEMAATVQEVARSASAAAGAAANADNEAKSGAVVINQATQAIGKLAGEIDSAAQVITGVEKNSDAIGSILDVIKAIAEQTNLLALNAAIEAARAGEQGRGFAVVADEVRTLASRTQKSTQEIEEMIKRLQDGSRRAVQVMQISRDQAQTVVKQANEASDALHAITRAVTTINEMNTQIASAAEQQNATTEEMNRSISGIRDVAEQTATGAAQSTSASEELARLATQLQSLINNFQIQNSA